MTSSYANYIIFIVAMIPKEKEKSLMYLIRHLQKLIDADFDKRLAEYGLTCQQGRILFFVARCHKEVHQNDIENEFHLSKSTVSGIVRRMEKKKLITIKKQHPYAIIEPGIEGKNVISHLAVHRQEAIDKLLQNIDKEKQEELLTTLNQLIKNMEGGDSNV